MDCQKLSFFIVMLSLAFVTIKYVSHTEWNTLPVLLQLGAIMYVSVILLILDSNYFNVLGSREKYRSKVSDGLYSIPLVPLTLLGNTAFTEILEGQKNQEIWNSLFSVFSIILCLLIKNAQMNKAIIASLILGGAFFVQCFDVLFLLTFTIVWFGISLIPSILPKSFTLGEISVILQLIVIWTNRCILAFLKLFTIGIITSTIIVCVSQFYTSLFKFLAVYVVTAMCALLFLNQLFNKNPIYWFLHFIFGHCSNIFLMTSWIILYSLTIVWTIFQGLTEGDHSIHNFDKFVMRKVFHVFIVLVYVPGIMMQTHLLLMASVVTLGLFIFVETARTLQVPLIGKHLDEVLKVFIDERDAGPVFLTPMYLLIGLSLAVWISPQLFESTKGSIEMYSGVLSLGIGDTVACLFGRKFGRIHYPGSKKTLDGTMASIFVQMTLVLLAVYLEVVQVNSMLTVFIGVALSSFFEAFTDQIDNLMLPLVIYPFLCYSQ